MAGITPRPQSGDDRFGGLADTDQLACRIDQARKLERGALGELGQVVEEPLRFPTRPEQCLERNVRLLKVRRRAYTDRRAGADERAAGDCRHPEGSRREPANTYDLAREPVGCSPDRAEGAGSATVTGDQVIHHPGGRHVFPLSSASARS